MSKKNEEQSNETRREAVTLAKIVIHVLNMKQRTFGDKERYLFSLLSISF